MANLFEIVGEQLLLRKLAKLEKAVGKKIGKKAITAGVKILAKAIKSEIPSRQKSARKAIGYSFKRPRSGKWKDIIFAKAGAGAGMSKKKREKAAAKKKESGPRKKKGVGIGVSNVMWLLAGTEKRWTGTKRVGAHKAGNTKRIDTGKKKRYTGRMKRSGIVQRAEAKSRSAVTAAIKSTFKSQLEIEAGKQ